MKNKINTFNPNQRKITIKKLNFYNGLSKEIYALAKTSDKITMKQLEDISEKIDILTSEKPLFVFYGYNLDNVLRPKTFPEEDFFVFDLAHSLDYQKDFREKIKLLSSIFDEYTIYTFIHGSKRGFLSLNENKKTSISDFANIIDQNRGNAIVNWISGSCHSGAGINKNIVKPGINLLLISGVNDVCYDSDTKFVRANDLISSYYDAVNAKRYGSILIYEGKVFNSLKEASTQITKEGKEDLKKELSVLNDIFFAKDELGENIFKLLIKRLKPKINI